MPGSCDDAPIRDRSVLTFASHPGYAKISAVCQAFDGSFAVFAGLGRCQQLLDCFRFEHADIEYLRTALPHLKPAFFDDFLAQVNQDAVEMHSLSEGTLALPSVPMLRVEGPLAIVQLLETPLLNLVNFATLVATNAARCRLATPTTVRLVEFGARRAQGPDGAMSASLYSYIGGFDATSNVLAGKLYGLPVRGTHSHSFVQSFAQIEDVSDELSLASATNDKVVTAAQFTKRVIAIREKCKPSGTSSNPGELAAFISYAMTHPQAFLGLVDTYDTLQTGTPNYMWVALALLELGYDPVGVRLDSGDLIALSHAVRATMKNIAVLYDNLHDTPCALELVDRLAIMASNDLDERKLRNATSSGADIQAYGIGTHLVTCKAQPALGGVFKLVELDGSPRVKFSEDASKAVIPARKEVYRVYAWRHSERTGRFKAPVLDVIADSSDVVDTDGARTIEYIPLSKFRELLEDGAVCLGTVESISGCHVERLLTQVRSCGTGRPPSSVQQPYSYTQACRARTLANIGLVRALPAESADYHWPVGLSRTLAEKALRTAQEMRRPAGRTACSETA